MKKFTMRNAARFHFTDTPPLSPEEIVEIRTMAEVSQAVFAKALNVNPSLVSQWESGHKSPGGPSLKLLALVKAKGFEHIL